MNCRALLALPVAEFVACAGDDPVQLRRLLSCAVRYGEVSHVSVLLTTKPVRPRKRDLRAACRRDDCNVVWAVFVSRSGVDPKEHPDALFERVNLKMIKFFHDQGFDVSSPYETTGETILTALAKDPVYSQLHFIKKGLYQKLLAFGLDPNVPNADGETPLFLVCADLRDRHRFSVRAAYVTTWSAIVDVLLLAGADPNKGNEEDTPVDIIGSMYFDATSYSANRCVDKPAVFDKMLRAGGKPNFAAYSIHRSEMERLHLPCLVAGTLMQAHLPGRNVTCPLRALPESLIRRVCDAL